MSSPRLARARDAGKGSESNFRRRGGFWAVAYAFTLVMLGTTMPTPLYVLYQAHFHFSEGAVTVIFATYAVGTLFALLFFGGLSDETGRSRARQRVRPEHRVHAAGLDRRRSRSSRRRQPPMTDTRTTKRLGVSLCEHTFDDKPGLPIRTVSRLSRAVWCHSRVPSRGMRR